MEDIKSPTPVIMNFHNSKDAYNAPFGTQNNSINEKVIDQLIAQLAVKDKYIEKLIAKLK